MTEAVIWLVVWALIFLAVPILGVITFLAIGGTGAVRAKTEKGKTGSGVVGFIVAAVGALALWVTAAVSGIIQIVTIIQLL